MTHRLFTNGRIEVNLSPSSHPGIYLESPGANLQAYREGNHLRIEDINPYSKKTRRMERISFKGPVITELEWNDKYGYFVVLCGPWGVPAGDTCNHYFTPDKLKVIPRPKH